MTTPQPLFAQWLQSENLWQVNRDAVASSRWGDNGVVASRSTCIAHKADAAAEAERQLAFLGGPLVEEEHILPGEWRGRIGQVWTITIDQLGYDAGIPVFIIDAADDRASGLSTVGVLRRL